MKRIYIIVILLFGVLFTKANLCDTVPTGPPQLFGGKVYEFKNYILIDSFIMNTPGDTNNIPFYPSLKFKSTDNRWYGYDRSVWQKLYYSRDTVSLSNRINQVNANQSVRWCNAVNANADTTGVTDVSGIVQTMINSGCKVIYFPHGTYLFTNTVQLKDSVTIIGDGRSTVIRLTRNKAGFHCGFTSGQWSTFSDFSIVGTYTDSTLQDGIRTDSCKGILISNVYFSRTGGYGVHFYKAKSSTEGNNIISCYADSCRGGFFCDFAEFNKISSTIIAYCDTGVNINAGNNTVSDCNITKGTIGIYLAGYNSGGEFNDAHTEITGNIIAHNFRAGLYATGVTNGEQFGHNIIRNNSVYDVYAETSDNLWFDDCDLGVDSLVFVNCSNTNLVNNKIWNAATGRPGPPSQFLRWRIVGAAPTITGVGYVGNTISLYDGATNSTFNIAHNNKVVDFSTSSAGRIRLNDSVVVGTYLFGGEASGGNLRLSSTTNSTKGLIYLGDSSVYDPVNKRIGINIINPSYPLHLYRTSGTNAIQMTNNGPTSLSFLRMTNDAGNVAQFFFGGSGSSPFVPNSGFEIDGQIYLGIVSENGQISFGKSTILNGSNEHGRFFNNSHFVLNKITDNGHQFQVNGGVTINKDSVPIITTIGSNYLLSIDTADNGNIKRISSANVVGIKTINSQVGPDYSISTGTGLTSSLGVNSIAIAVDVNSTDLTHVVDKQFIDANNSGTAETDLYSKSIAANTLINNGASIHFDVAGQLNDATATADIQFYFAGTSFGNTGALTLSTTGAWSARGYVIRATSTTARAFVTFTTQSASTASYTFETDLTGLDFTTGNILKVTGQAGGATGGSNDITAKTWKLIFQP